MSLVFVFYLNDLLLIYICGEGISIMEDKRELRLSRKVEGVMSDEWWVMSDELMTFSICY